MRDGWEAEAGKWAAFTRTPGHDSSQDDINLPALRELLPEPGHRTLDPGLRRPRPATPASRPGGAGRARGHTGPWPRGCGALAPPRPPGLRDDGRVALLPAEEPG